MSKLNLWQQDRIHLNALILGLVILVGALLRYVQLTRALNASLDPDVIGYLTIARRIISGNFDFTEPGQAGLFTREPLHPLVLAFSLWISSPASGDVVARATSSVISVFVIPATYLLARRLFDSSVALVASLLVALNGILVILSSRGLREDMVSLLLLVFLVSAYGLGNGRHAGRTSLNYLCSASILSVLLVVTRFEMLYVTIAVAALLLVHPSTHTLRDRLRSSMAIACSSLVGLIINMAIAYAAKVDPFGPSKAQASWMFWFEFSLDHSTSYIQQGIWIGMYEYLFGHHSIGRLLFLEVRGLKFLLENMNAIFMPYPIWNSTVFVDFYIFIITYVYKSYPFLATFPAMAYAGVAGLVHALRRQEGRFIVLPLLLPTATYCFIYGIINVGDSIRFVAQFFPILFVTTSALLLDVVRTASGSSCSAVRDEMKRSPLYLIGMAVALMAVALILTCP